MAIKKYLVKNYKLVVSDKLVLTLLETSFFKLFVTNEFWSSKTKIAELEHEYNRIQLANNQIWKWKVIGPKQLAKIKSQLWKMKWINYPKKLFYFTFSKQICSFKLLKISTSQ